MTQKLSKRIETKEAGIVSDLGEQLLALLAPHLEGIQPDDISAAQITIEMAKPITIDVRYVEHQEDAEHEDADDESVQPEEFPEGGGCPPVDAGAESPPR